MSLDELMRAIEHDAPWKLHAACRGCDPELFFPERGTSLTSEYARRVCKTCTVSTECGIAGLGEKHGVWGGMTERQRRRQRLKLTVEERTVIGLGPNVTKPRVGTSDDQPREAMVS